MQEFINLRQRSMCVKKYALDFTKLSKYALTIVADSRVEMSRFISRVSNLVEKEFCTKMLHHDMNISHIMVYAQ